MRHYVNLVLFMLLLQASSSKEITRNLFTKGGNNENEVSNEPKIQQFQSLSFGGTFPTHTESGKSSNRDKGAFGKGAGKGNAVLGNGWPMGLETSHGFTPGFQSGLGKGKGSDWGSPLGLVHRMPLPTSQPTIVPPTFPPTFPPTDGRQKCIEAAVRQVEGRFVVDIRFNYIGLTINRDYVRNCDDRDRADPDLCVNGTITDLTPLGNDWIGLYPCSDANTEPLAFNKEPKVWAYACYDENCHYDPGVGVGAGFVTFDDKTLPPFGNQGIHTTIDDLVKNAPGCYVILLNRLDGYSPPPYYNICLGNNITLGL
mmetsp:Transcript_30749/g.46621  ORF Transcript_30749/g.46621 Transcript_30749/m.46621 type:complete len:313 (-) Transcript_30749:67-1005(-)